MLVFTRKITETVRINDDIHITILGIKGNQVRLGFDAPKNVIINREEIHQKIKAEEALFLKEPRTWRVGQDVLTH